MKEAEMERIAGWMDQALRNRADEAALAQVRDEVFALTAKFPIPE
jgi:glycine/serine hydroxymethyltransferase